MTLTTLHNDIMFATGDLLDRWPALAAPTHGGTRSAVAQALFTRAIRGLPVTVEFPDGTCLGRGGPLMRLHRPGDFYARVGGSGLIGFGESYMAGDFDAEDLAGFLTELCRSLTALVPRWMQWLRGLYVAPRPRCEDNTVRQARGNIARHYDLSNDLFSTFLDESMTYSGALFTDLGRPEPLIDAQHRKIDRLLDLAGVGAGTRMLEIGTGWGELAVRAAARGAEVYSVTLSVEQFELARARVASAGYDDRARIELRDYRDIPVPATLEDGYDAVVSVEMIEAVGREYWPTYFTTLDSLLAPGGKVALQAITMPHDQMMATRDTWTWVHKYIFPGGFLPSTESIAQTVHEHTTLGIHQRLSMGPHYVRTLREWDTRFRGAHNKIADLGFDHVFERMWHFYLCYSEAGFASGYLDVQQILLAREGR